MTALLAIISGEALIRSLVWVIVVALIFWLLWWLISYCKVPEPFNTVLRVILAIFAVVILINFLLGFIGTPFIRW